MDSEPTNSTTSQEATSCARRMHTRGSRPTSLAMAGGIIALMLLLLANLARILRALHEKWVSTHPERAPEQAASIWYERMARALARRGVRRATSQTPQEFIRKIEDQRLREPVARFT